MSLKLVSFVKCTNSYFFGVQSKDNIYSVIVARNTVKLLCNCHWGSNVGVNSSKLCKHKKFVADIIEKIKGEIE
jgi:hypothetical protein